MSKKTDLAVILEQPLNRRQFFGYAGLFVMTLFGINDMLSRLHQTPSTLQNHKSGGRNFGAGRFGV